LIEGIPASLHILELIEQIAVMQQTIQYLKLDSQERALQARQRAEESVRQAKTLVEEIEGATDEIVKQRNIVLVQVESSFGQLQSALAEREQQLINEVNSLAEQSISKYQVLELEAQEELEAAQAKQQEVLRKQPSEVTEADLQPKSSRMKVPVPEFNLKFLCDEEPVVAYLTKVGRVGRWVVKAPYECKHFSNVTYWMLPPCCFTYYCCNKCHDLTEQHPWQYATRMVCMYCDHEQPYKKLPNVCDHCSIAHKGVVSK
jgi:hypothetical protein